VETGEGDQVDGQLAEVGVELSGEAQAAGDAAHRGRDQMVQIADCKGEKKHDQNLEPRTTSVGLSSCLSYLLSQAIRSKTLEKVEADLPGGASSQGKPGAAYGT
jgi:hypothetical protein